MKLIIQKFWMVMAILCLSLNASAYDFEVDGIYYNILSLEDLTCEVTYNANNKSTQILRFLNHRGAGSSTSSISSTYPSYTGDVTIPSKVNYKGRELSVTGIGSRAFLNCTGLKSLSLPASIVQINEVLVSSSANCYAGAFDYCDVETLIVGNAYTLEMFDQSYAEYYGYRSYDNLKNLVLAEDFNGTIGVDFSYYKKLVSIRSNVVEVPTFSEGSHFTNEQFLNDEVLVPEKSFANYQSADVWKDFWDLKAMKTVKSITLNETSLSLEPNQTIQLIANVLPEDAFDTSLTWISSDPNVASVDTDGIVTAHTKGDAVITVSSNDGSGITAECAVSVDLLVKELELSATEIGLEPGDTKKLEVTINPAEAFVKDVIWSSDNEEIASVDQDGNVTAKTVGIAVITVQTTDGSNLSANCEVKVAELVKSISVLPAETTIKEGETIQLSCSVAPESATYKEVKWTSDDSDVATVNSDGLVTAVSSGTTKIKANASDDSGVYGECTITVTAETIELNGICYQRNSPSTLKIVANTENPYGGDFFIPAQVINEGNEMQVTEIGAGAFSNCQELTRLVIPNTIDKVKEPSFDGCSKLEYVKICDGSLLETNLDNLFPDSPIKELYIGSDNIAYNATSRILANLKGMILGNSVMTFPPKEVFSSLEYFVVEDGEEPIVEPSDYCTSSMSLVTKQTINDSYTLIMYRIYYLVTYTHLSPILVALQNSTLNYLHIGRDVVQIEVDTSKTQELIPTTAGSRYQEYGYKDEIYYQYQEGIVKSNYVRTPVESISINESIVGLHVGEVVKLSVEYTPANVSYVPVEWLSSDEQVASVDVFGNVTKISEGEAVITVRTIDDSNLSASCKIVNFEDVIEDGIINVSDNGLYEVYNLLGIKLLETYDVQKVKQLPSGIYIVNGKMIAIK